MRQGRTKIDLWNRIEFFFLLRKVQSWRFLKYWKISSGKQKVERKDFILSRSTDCWRAFAELFGKAREEIKNFSSSTSWATDLVKLSGLAKLASITADSVCPALISVSHPSYTFALIINSINIFQMFLSPPSGIISSLRLKVERQSSKTELYI